MVAFDTPNQDTSRNEALIQVVLSHLSGSTEAPQVMTTKMVGVVMSWQIQWTLLTARKLRRLPKMHGRSSSTRFRTCFSG